MSFLSRMRSSLSSLQAYAPPSQSPPVKLDANESPWPLPSEVQEAIAQTTKSLPLHRYPDARANRLRRALARYLQCDEKMFLLGVGSDEIISILYSAFGVGTVLIPTPTFSMYRISALTHGLTPVEVLLNDDWSLDLDAMKKVFDTHRPIICFYARPNNPTGNAFSSDALQELIEHASDTLHIIDEAYIAFHRDSPEGKAKTLRKWASKYENVAIMGTLSKIGLAGVRVGWLYASVRLITELDKVRQPFNLNALAQETARLVLDEFPQTLETQIQNIIRERERVIRTLSAHKSIRMLWPSEANFVLVQPTSSNTRGWATELRTQGIGIRTFERPPLSNLARISIGTPEENDLLFSSL